MTEQQTPEEEAPVITAGESREVNFRGHKFTAYAPQPEQILVWQRTLDRLSQANTATWKGKDALAALDRIRKILDSLLSPEDIDWLDDQMLQRDPETRMPRFTLENAHELMMEIINAFRANNREERREAERAAKKTAPARRKAPAKKTTPGRTAR
jgi:hypothetical protein